MLNELDKELEARGLDFVRYADDLIIMVGSRQAAERVMKSVARFIEERLGLKVNASNTAGSGFTLAHLPKHTKPDRTRRQSLSSRPR